MAHREQVEFCNKVKDLFPNHFHKVKVLDVGSFDCNGNDRGMFIDSEYIGIDLTEGDNVDVICPCQEYDAPDEYFDTVISCECFEHNPYYKETIQNIVRMLKPGGLFLFTCATTGRAPHGFKTQDEIMKKIDPNWTTLPNVKFDREDWDNDYYKNLTEEDIRECVDMDKVFSDCYFEIEEEHFDLYFWGVKK